MSNMLENTNLFEVSWEVCNKVGGIYQVVSSKAIEATKTFGDNYYLLGPDLGSNAEFEETNEPCWDIARYAATQISLPCRFGRWKIPGNPKVILVKFTDRYDSNQLLHNLWRQYGVDSLLGGWDYIEPVMFSTACSEVINACYHHLVKPGKGKIIAHFHEWMCGAGLLDLKKRLPEAGTVFTTHATILGRSMAGSGFDIYRQMAHINPTQEAGTHNITAKYSMEKVAAREADCFTTVSDITSEEAGYFLAKRADIVTPNGLDLDVIPDYYKDRKTPTQNKKTLLAAVSKMLRHEIAPDTRVFLISGRYEYHNKGIDTYIDALGSINAKLKDSDAKILALCAAMGGHSGVNPDAIGTHFGKKPPYGDHWLCSHNIFKPDEDPILKNCQRLGLTNSPDNPVQFIFVPALLDGHDGFLNMAYYDVLSTCDLGVFPSWYEPWGYTPQESAALAVPTVTTDLSGFGNWVRNLPLEKTQKQGITILPRHQTTYQETVTALEEVMLQYATWNTEELDEARKSVRELSEHCSWKHFFPHYTKAYSLASEKAQRRYLETVTPQRKLDITIEHAIPTVQSSTPRLRSFKAVTKLPEKISRLSELGSNLWWYWHPRSWKLFEDLNREVWHTSNHNPLVTLSKTPGSKLEALAKDTSYIRRYEEIMAQFDAYMNEPPKTFGKISSSYPVAYFSMEYGLAECLPLYSGGLGVLSGDHLKSASDLNIPLVGVGLLYKCGYFQQTIDKNKRQVDKYIDNIFSDLPMELVRDLNGNPITVSINGLGPIHAQIWKVNVGRVPLYLMDTDIPSNSADNRNITARLYESNREFRFKQEVFLGIGGTRVLQAVGITPSVFHMNEGHSALLVLERIRVLMRTNNITFAEAAELVRGTTIFTTHTPVEAGNETFALDVIDSYFKHFAQRMGLKKEDLIRLGKPDDSERNVFEMTLLALNYSYKTNGVSAMHEVVSKNMWQRNWKGLPAVEAPIGHVTNGIHVPTYTSPAMNILLERYIDEDWVTTPAKSPIWDKVTDIPDNELWSVKQLQKDNLLTKIRLSLPELSKKYNIPSETQASMQAYLTPGTLIIGFARRFAPYKRATLLFADPDRLHAIIKNRQVIFVFAGKAHPADTQGQDILEQIINYTLDPRFIGRVFFLEDYNIRISKAMVAGCDVWLNTPRRPYEASGTSGQKVPVNAGLNLSVSDGWWCEGYNGQNGWTIGPVLKGDVLPEHQHDYDDAESLYNILEEEVLPLYFDRDNTNKPLGWIKKVKNSLRSLTSKYSSNRMVASYVHDYYVPAASRGRELYANNLELAKKLASWKADMARRFHNIRITSLSITGIDENDTTCSNPVSATLTIAPGTLTAEDLLVELVAGSGDEKGFLLPPDVIRLAFTSQENGELTYTGTFYPTEGGNYAYGIRVMPTTEGLGSPFETRLILWG